MFSAPLILWFALACCAAVTLGAPPVSELDTAESSAQGWFKGIGIGHFSFGDEAETKEKYDASKDEDETFKIYKFGLSELQKKQLAEEQNDESEKSQEGQKDEAKMQTESQGGQEGAESQEQKEEEVKVVDYYYGRRGQQQPAFAGHIRTKNLAKEYAIVEEMNENADEDAEDKKEEKIEEIKTDEGVEQSSDLEEIDPSEVVKDFYSGFKGYKGQGHKNGQQNYAAYSTVRQTSYFPSIKVNKEQVSESDEDTDSDSKYKDGYSFHLVLPVKH